MSSRAASPPPGPLEGDMDVSGIDDVKETTPVALAKGLDVYESGGWMKTASDRGKEWRNLHVAVEQKRRQDSGPETPDEIRETSWKDWIRRFS